MSAKTQRLGARRRPYVNPNFLSSQRASAIVNTMADLTDSLSRRRVAYGDLYDFVSSEADHTALNLLIDSVWTKYASGGVSHITGKADVHPRERKEAAIAKWLVSERRNAKTNFRILWQDADFGFATSNQILNLAAKFARETLGVKPPANFAGTFTGGASTRVKRGDASIAKKFEGKAHSSTSAIPYWTGTLFQSSLWSLSAPLAWSPEVQESSVMFTVPKTSEIDRVACKEPEVNMYLQRGAGDFIRKRLKRSGIDLNDQTRNQHLAYVGSLNVAGSQLATIDLSSASDTISRAIVGRILPSEWYKLLDDLRVKETRMPDGSLHQLEMFSSMGNGFTFELESLIFWVLVRAVATSLRCPGRIGVYGDDIICHPRVARALTRVLPWFGFKMNVSKSHLRGQFRESCGSWYSVGMDVTPFYFRELPTKITDVISLANQLMKWLLKRSVPELLHPWLMAAWVSLADHVPVSFHGGQSLDRSDALVTGVAPRRRLLRILSNRDRVVLRNNFPDLGGYLWWHHEKDRSPLLVIEPTRGAVSDKHGFWVSRPNESEYERELMYRVRYMVSLIRRDYSREYLPESL